MKTIFVPVDLAKHLKEAGFKERCVAHYYGETVFEYNSKKTSVWSGKIQSSDFFNCYNADNRNRKNLDAPTIDQVLGWLGRERGIYILLEPFPSTSTIEKVIWSWSFKWNSDGVSMDRTEPDDNCYSTREDAALAGIRCIIKLGLL